MVPPTPESVMVDFTSTSSLTINLTLPSDNTNVERYLYMFTVTGEDCGCVSMNVSTDPFSVPCSGWTANGQTCSFEVKIISQDCEVPGGAIDTSVTLAGEYTSTK